LKNFESDYTLKGVFFSYTTPVDCIIKSPKHKNLYEKTNKNQGLFLVQVEENGKYAIELKNNSKKEVELMLAVHFGK